MKWPVVTYFIGVLCGATLSLGIVLEIQFRKPLPSLNIPSPVISADLSGIELIGVSAPVVRDVCKEYTKRGEHCVVIAPDNVIPFGSCAAFRNAKKRGYISNKLEDCACNTDVK